MIDHTILKPDATEAEVGRFCREAIQHGFRSVCVNSVHVPLVAAALRGSEVLTCAVVGFPLGAMPSAIKAAETRLAVENGAGEIDMVIPVGALIEGRNDAVRDDIAAVRDASRGAVLKVIIETCLLTDEQKRTACRLSVEAGADFVKTSTGFSSGGATTADIRLMRETVGPKLGVKASGGVRTPDVARAMIEAGATRIGTSSGISLISAGEAPAGSY
ncbi:deoxyribose-phosphate aldolase [Acetobacteraceae bacterium KSS12]|uniref:Deoxyribose-phosphate aldolase n=2 Tax=Rhizosaccharibacter radicis TaxID=2782605 RepID=A0ABT1VZS8_9PROT|nr:deoxyribose-phosphate aldolase [Acetobacteraceae bacterium KSS12]